MKRTFSIVSICLFAVCGLRTAPAAALDPAEVEVFAEPFVGTTWGQSTDTGYPDGSPCFNYRFVERFGFETNYCGCVATAVAQVMRHFEWPQAELAATNFVVRNLSRTPPTDERIDLPATRFAWDQMPKDTTAGIPEANRRAIGQLTWDIALSSWTEVASGLTMTSVASSFCRIRDRYGYASAESVWFAGAFPYDEERLKRMVIPCCDYGTPVILSVTDGDYQHEVVVDGYGYSKGEFCVHVLYGGGARYCDGWYRPPDFSADYALTTVTNVQFNILPQERGTLVSGRIRDAAGNAVKGATVVLKRGDETVRTTTSRSRGIYVLLVPEPGNWTVAASADGRIGITNLTVVANESRQLVSEFELDFAAQPVLGNLCDADIALAALYDVTTATPVILPAGGTFGTAQTVTLSCATPEAIIRYTFDAEADESVGAAEKWSLYTGPLEFCESCQLKALAWSYHAERSAVARASFEKDESVERTGDRQARPKTIDGASGSLKVEHLPRYTVDSDAEMQLLTLSGGRYLSCHHTLWLRWIAPGSGRVTFYSATSRSPKHGYDWGSYLSVFAGTSTPTLASRLGFTGQHILPVSSFTEDEYYAPALDGSCVYDLVDDNWCALNKIAVNVEQGETYWIAVSCPYDLVNKYSDPDVFLHVRWKSDLSVMPTETEVEADGLKVSLSHAWMRQHFPSAAPSDYAALAQQRAANGRSVAESFLLGLDPNDSDAQLRVTLKMGATGPELDYEPKSVRVPENGYFYRLKGRIDLGESVWGPITAASRFFRLFVER